MSNYNMDIRTLRKTIYAEILTKQSVLHHSTYEKLLNKFNNIKGKNTLLKFQANELKAFNSRTDTFGKIKEIKKERKAFLQSIKEKSKAIKEKYNNSVIEIDVPRYKDFLKNDIISKLRSTLQKQSGKSVIIEYVINDSKIGLDLVFTAQEDIPKTFSSWWHSFTRKYIFIPYNIFEMKGYKGMVYIIPEKPFKPLEAYKIQQTFLDGITHCVFTPIKEWAITTGENCKSKESKKKYNAILNKLETLEEQFKDGLPEDQVAFVCNKLQIDISVELPLIDEDAKFIHGQSMKKRLKHFRFMNTRFNHVELNEIVSMNDFDIVTRKELMSIKNELDNKNMFYKFGLDKIGISSISTINKQYKLSNVFRECVNNFEQEVGLNVCKLDDVCDRELSQFVLDGTHYNTTIDFKNISNVKYIESVIEDEKEVWIKTEYEGVHINHIDMKKAYANFKSCKYYQGFLGKVTDFRITDKIQGVGIYKITHLDFSNCNERFKMYINKLNCYVDNNVYPSPELEMLKQNGALFDIVCGCWGVSSFDFDFNHEMLNGVDENGIKYYAKYTGLMDSHYLNTTFYLNGDEDFYCVLAEKIGQDRVRFFPNNRIKVIYPKQHNYHLGHITSFITMYQRLNVIDQLMEIEYNNVVRVCVDGIYHLQENVELVNVFRSKDEFTFSNDAGESYASNVYVRPLTVEGHSSRECFIKELHLGEGGCGKTHMNCTDKGLMRVMFVAPSWKLARNKEKELGIKSTVWARALSDDPDQIKFIREHANVLIVDEVSMLSEGQKEKFFKLYPDMKIIMCGDIGYQLPCITGEVMSNDGFGNIVQHTTDYRCVDAKLKRVKNVLRELIENGYPTKEINKFVVEEFRKMGKVITVEELKTKYNIDDMILSGTNELKNYYTELFKGKFNKEKYYIMENNRQYCNGDIVIGEKPEGVKAEVRHCFTCHSIQGETAYHKLFIDCMKMFDPCMFYTAISRAKTLDQIFIVENENIKKYKYEFAKIYKISSGKSHYIGSTVQTLDNRFNEHKRDYENYKIGKHKFVTSFEVLKLGDAKISLVEMFKCDSVEELQKRESEVIKLSDCVNKTFKQSI